MRDAHGPAGADAPVLRVRRRSSAVEGDLQREFAGGCRVGRDRGDGGWGVVGCGADTVGLVGWGVSPFLPGRILREDGCGTDDQGLRWEDFGLKRDGR